MSQEKIAFPTYTVAMVTPFDETGRIEESSFCQMIDHLINNGVEGIVLTGSTGEAHSMTVEEKARLYQLGVQHTNGRIPIYAGTGLTTTQGSIELTQTAERAGVTGVMIGVPYYIRPSQGELYQHYLTIADTVDVPILLYNNPPRTGTDMSLDTIVRLSKHERIIGHKEGSSDVQKIADLVGAVPDDFGIYIGSETMLLSAFAVGVSGLMSVTGNLFTRQIGQMLHLLQDKRLEEVREIYKKFAQLFEALFSESSPVPLKAAMKLKGLPAGYPRKPLGHPSKELLDKIEALLFQLKEES